MNSSVGEAASVAGVQPGSDAAAMQTPGAMLEHERTRQGLSVQQAAEGLHLDTWIVEAIEANRFVALGAPVYAKGYLRKYALLLGLAPDVIVARYEASTDTLPIPTPVPVITTTPPPRPKWPKYLAWTLLIGVLIAIGAVVHEYVWPVPPEPATSTVESTVTLPPASDAPAPVAVPTPSEPSTTATPAVVAPPLAQDVQSPAISEERAPTQQPAAAAVPATSGELVRLTLAFSDPSWAEVYDASGRRLLYDIGQADRSRTVEGAAPLNVVIGVAAAVKMRVNDREIIVPRRANRDSTRFVVNANGSVQ